MARYELDDGTLRRFWEISRVGSVITIRTGALGEEGRPRTKDHRTEERAKLEEHNAVQAMTRLGYVEVRDAEARPEALQRALAERTPDALRVLADWLLDQSDPFGSVLAKALAGADDEGERARLDRQWFPSPAVTALWEGGRPVRLRIEATRDDVGRGLARFFRTPAGQLLDRLEIRGVHADRVLGDLVSGGPIDGLWHLRILEGPLDLPGLGGALPALRSIEVSRGFVELGAPRLPQLARLSLEIDGASDHHTFGNVRHARFPALREIQIHAGRPGAFAGRGFGEMLAHSPGLERASFRRVDLGGMMEPWLAPGVPRALELLALWGCRLTDADGTRLLQALHALPTARVELDANRFSRDTADALAALANVAMHPGIDDDESDYYDAIVE